VVAKDYFIETNKLKISADHHEKSLKIPLPKAEVGKKFTFKNMLFLGNKSIMLPQSEPALQHLKRFMFLNTEHCIEVAGHINLPSNPKVDTDSGHFDLSVARAIEVHDALCKVGVIKDRILARGYGNWEMVYPFAKSESQMRLNRRVEIIITECDSTRLIENHEVVRKSLYSKVDPPQRKYNEYSFEEDIQFFPEKAQKDLKKQIKLMKRKKVDPSQFTYLQMLKAFPEIPKVNGSNN